MSNSTRRPLMAIRGFGFVHVGLADDAEDVCGRPTDAFFAPPPGPDHVVLCDSAPNRLPHLGMALADRVPQRRDGRVVPLRSPPRTLGVPAAA